MGVNPTVRSKRTQEPLLPVQLSGGLRPYVNFLYTSPVLGLKQKQSCLSLKTLCFADGASDGIAMNCEIVIRFFVFLKSSSSCIVGSAKITLIGLIFIYQKQIVLELKPVFNDPKQNCSSLLASIWNKSILKLINPFQKHFVPGFYLMVQCCLKHGSSWISSI